MAFGTKFLKRARNALLRKLPYILLIIQPHPELSEAACGHRATPFAYNTFTLKSAQENTDELNDEIQSMVSDTGSAEPLGDEMEWKCIVPVRDNRASFYSMVDSELVQTALPPVEFMRLLLRGEEMAVAFNLGEMCRREAEVEAQDLAAEVITASNPETADSYGRPSAEWQRNYREGAYSSGRRNSQSAPNRRFSSSSSSSSSCEFPIRERINQGFDNREEAYNTGGPNRTILSGLCSSSLLERPTVPRIVQSGIGQVDALEPARESLDRLQGIEGKRTGWPKSARADVLESEDSQKMALVRRKRSQCAAYREG